MTLLEGGTTDRNELGDAPARDDRAVRVYVERLGDALTDAGMPRLASRVFAQLLADDDGRMTAGELTEALEVSPAAISGAVRYLTHTMLIGKERERGTRRDVYVVQVEFLDFVARRLEALMLAWEERKAEIIRGWPTDH